MKNFYVEVEKIPKIYGVSIVIIVAILASYVGNSVFEITKDIMVAEKGMLSNEKFETIMNVTKYITMGTTFFSSIVGWVLYAGVFFLLSLIFNRNSPFKRILFLSSYGYLFSVISSFIIIYLLGETDFSTYETMYEIQKIIGQYQYIGYLLNLFFAFYMIGVIWYVCEIKIWQAVVVAVAPVLLFTLFSIAMQSASIAFQQM